MVLSNAISDMGDLRISRQFQKLISYVICIYFSASKILPRKMKSDRQTEEQKARTNKRKLARFPRASRLRFFFKKKKYNNSAISFDYEYCRGLLLENDLNWL